MERGFIFPLGKCLLQLGKQIFADSVDRAGAVESDVTGLTLFGESLEVVGGGQSAVVFIVVDVVALVDGGLVLVVGAGLQLATAHATNIAVGLDGINEDIVEINGGSTMTLSTVYKLKVSLADALALIQKHLPATVQMDEKKNHVFIIDEINRGNISKIFGELITLIESSKRIGQPEGMRAKLPYSQQLFGVPDNVYIIGTMNTADRSIATIDTALRRRFRFKEMMPDADVLKGISVEDISVSEMLARMNKRISVLYDREHTIGHAYFIPLRDNPTIEQLAEIFENAIVPLLQEYFYEDYEKIRLVLGDNKKENKEEQFIVVVENDYNELFGSTDIGFDDSVTYEINRAAFDNIEAYRSI